MNYDNIKKQAREAVEEILEVAKLKEGDLFVVGCSTSEVGGHSIGRDSNLEIAEAIFDGIYPVLFKRGINLAAQCCEHLNRAVILERDAVPPWMEIVNVVPQIHAGGSFSVVAYDRFSDPVAVESIKADAGIDIGDTLIGMHLKHVAVPLRIKTKEIGHAHVLGARTRPKYIGGERACYDEKLSGGDIKRPMK